MQVWPDFIHYVRVFRHFFGSPSRSQLAKIRLPCHISGADDDPVIGSCGPRARNPDGFRPAHPSISN